MFLLYHARGRLVRWNSLAVAWAATGTGSAQCRSLPFMLPLAPRQHRDSQNWMFGGSAIVLDNAARDDPSPRLHCSGSHSSSSCFPCSSAAVHHHLTQRGRPIAWRYDFMALCEHRCAVGSRLPSVQTVLGTVSSGLAFPGRSPLVLGECMTPDWPIVATKVQAEGCFGFERDAADAFQHFRIP